MAVAAYIRSRVAMTMCVAGAFGEAPSLTHLIAPGAMFGAGRFQRSLLGALFRVEPSRR